MLCNLMGNEKCSQCGLTFEWIHLNGYRQCSDCCRKALDRQRELVAAHPVVDVRPSDEIAIRHPTGVYLGRVSWATNWGDTIGWHIGFVHLPGSAGRVGDPGVWKLGTDGGTVEVRSRPATT